jgi:hypothetical protein
MEEPKIKVFEVEINQEDSFIDEDYDDALDSFNNFLQDANEGDTITITVKKMTREDIDLSED